LNAFQYLKMGKASALAWTLFVVVFALSLIQFRWYVKQVER
jgi:ABC-type sugar transport system permease subunit